MSPTHVLVPLDGSPLSEEALEHAFEVYDCEVTVLNVVTPVDAKMSEGGILEPDPERVAAARERAETLLSRARDRAGELDRSVETVVEEGDPADAIVEVVDRIDVDHVVMGGHGGPEGGVATRILGTVATTVVAEAPVSVTVIR